MVIGKLVKVDKNKFYLKYYDEKGNEIKYTMVEVKDEYLDLIKDVGIEKILECVFEGIKVKEDLNEDMDIIEQIVTYGYYGIW